MVQEWQLPLLPEKQWERFLNTYMKATGNEAYTTEWLVYVGMKNHVLLATTQWKAWLHWVATFKITGVGDVPREVDVGGPDDPPLDGNQA